MSREILARVEFDTAIGKQSFTVTARPPAPLLRPGVNIVHAIKCNGSVAEAFVDHAAMRVVATAMLAECDRLDAIEAAKVLP